MIYFIGLKIIERRKKYFIILFHIYIQLNGQNLSISERTDATHYARLLVYLVKPSKKKSRIRETKHLSTDADSSTDAIGGWTKAKLAKKNFFLRGDFRPLPKKNVQMLDHFLPLLFPKDSESLKILDIRHREVGAKRPLKKTENRRRPKKVKEEKNFFLRGDFRQFSNKNVHIWDHFFPLLFPKDSESLKILDIHTQTDRRTFRLIESIGPEGRCF